MTMPRLREAERQGQPLPILNICWDELFEYLEKLFRPMASKAWTEFGNLDASVVTNYTKVFEAEVEAGFEGRLSEISLHSSRADTTLWTLTIVDAVQFTDKRIYQSFTFNYGGMRIASKQKILVTAKTDGTATDIAAALTGELVYLGK